MKRTFSKKSISLHKDVDVKQQLKNIDNLQLTSENILQKLLHPGNLQKKQSQQNKKYNPKFQKRDYETVVDQNATLKQNLKQERQMTANLKFRLTQSERKIKFLQGIQEKWEETVEGKQDGRKQSVYTQILKKKIQQLNELYLSSEQKIKQLKHLPHVSVFDESSVEKEYLIRETIRLKSIITSMTMSGQQEQNLQNKFLKLMKEENQKLKSTIRLFENDKNLLKSRQIIQRRQINDCRKEIDALKHKITNKEAQIQKLNNQNKNLLFKRVNQLKIEEQKKQNEQISKLKQMIDKINEQKIKLQGQKQNLSNQYQKLKKNQKLNQTKQNNEDKQKNDLRMQNTRLRRTIQQLREQLQKQKQNVRLLQSQNRKKRRQKSKPITAQKIQHFPPVKYEDIQLSLFVLLRHLQTGTIATIADLFDQDELKCGRLIDLFCQDPLGLDRSEATKLARYIVQDNNQNKIVYNQKATATKQICVMTLKAALNKLQECRNPQNEDIWRCILAKSKKLIPELQKMKDESLSKQNVLVILSRHINQSFGDYVTYLLMQSFDLQASESEVMVRVEKMIEVLNNFMMNKSMR